MFHTDRSSYSVVKKHTYLSSYTITENVRMEYYKLNHSKKTNVVLSHYGLITIKLPYY